ncbi:MAG: DNA integrity scanning diadenylate cyclase DisA [Tomitella sp.]|nr:DNA integrity scanning diadenylate cyclase DisA [Tomitella sp.]
MPNEQRRPTAGLRDTIARLAPGTALRDGLERILRGRTGALVALGYDPLVESICDGGFELDVAFAPTRMRELAKMDGAVILSTDGTRILRANVQLMPDSSLPTEESGTRHRAAERTAIQTGYPVVSVSQSTSIVSVYVGGRRHVIETSGTILSRANQAVATLERYRSRLDEVNRHLSVIEIEDYVTLRDAMTVVQRLEMVRRLSAEIEKNVIELGTDGRQLALQLEELVGSRDSSRELLVRDYLPGHSRPTGTQVREVLDAIERLTDADLLDLTTVARTFGYTPTIEALDAPIMPRGYRLLTRVPRLQYTQVDNLVESFGTLHELLAATAADLQSVDGVTALWSRHIREGLSRLAEAGITERLA